jgi:hypothetical protein
MNTAQRGWKGKQQGVTMHGPLRYCNFKGGFSTSRPMTRPEPDESGNMICSLSSFGGRLPHCYSNNTHIHYHCMYSLRKRELKEYTI